MFKLDILGDVQASHPDVEPLPDRRNELPVVPYEDLVHGSIGAEES